MIKKQFVVRKVRVPTPVIQKIPIVRKVQARINTKVLPAQTLVLRTQGGQLAAAAGFDASALGAGYATGYTADAQTLGDL